MAANAPRARLLPLVETCAFLDRTSAAQDVRIPKVPGGFSFASVAWAVNRTNLETLHWPELNSLQENDGNSVLQKTVYPFKRKSCSSMRVLCLSSNADINSILLRALESFAPLASSND